MHCHVFNQDKGFKGRTIPPPPKKFFFFFQLSSIELRLGKLIILSENGSKVGVRSGPFEAELSRLTRTEGVPANHHSRKSHNKVGVD